jgi:hypothetical protein
VNDAGDNPHFFPDALSKRQTSTVEHGLHILECGVSSMTDDPGLIQKGTRHRLLQKFATSRSFTPLSAPYFSILRKLLSANEILPSSTLMHKYPSCKFGQS